MASQTIDPRKRRPMPPDLYRGIVRNARAWLDRIETNCEPENQFPRKALTVSIRKLSNRHAAQIGTDGAWIDG